MAWVPRTRWLIGDVRREAARELRAAYDRGASIREIATEAGLSYTATHRLLREAGTPLRARGPRPGGPSSER
ncbi:helix-turn-helix domain-containing protein [Embleya sp. NPDC059237]|uniref:helix-turn-helix domain-containing protein n=1 Tax=Embleya sp. NPDC059237 TaxID=3346784 RepID=UPI0036C37842